ncbi:WD40-repeat-containing domain protein [Mycena epipterygia]|nr:WD40-repeat-containing domain protein [Mycena epipterygia]
MTPASPSPTTPKAKSRIQKRANSFFRGVFKSSSQKANTSSQSSPVTNNARLAWHGFKALAKTAEDLLEGTPFKIPIAALNALIETADAIIDNKDSIAELLSPIRERLEIVSKELQLKDRRDIKDIDPTLQRFAGTLQEVTKTLQMLHERGLFKRILERDEDLEEITNMTRRVDEGTKNLLLELNLASFRQINAVKDNTEVLRLRELRPIRQVRHASLQISSCVTGTREDIIDNIVSWCKDTSQNVPAIYWLSGMAGTGKSTIAFTVCKQLDSDRQASRLAASFFCSRQTEAGRKRSNIMPTVAHDLAFRLPRFRRALLDAQVDANPPALEHHLRDLLVGPWDESIPDREGLPPLVVVLDALDELENSGGSLFMEELINQIAGHRDHFRGLKFLVTSRRDPRIVEIGKSLSAETVYRLEEVPTTTVQKDINIYLCASLPRLDPNQLRRLADQASGLFIYAATAVRFIIPQHASRHPPPHSVQKDRFEVLLNSWPGELHCSAEGLLVDHLYEDILTRYILPMAEVDRRIALAVLHTVLCTEEPIFVSDISHLWDKMDQDTIMDVLEHLHSVLYISSGRVYSYPKSFVDFMFDPTRFTDHELAVICSPTSDAQFRLAMSCFHLMDSLQFNICGLPSSFLNDSEINDFPEHLEKHIPSSLRGERLWALLVAHRWLNTNKTPDERDSHKDLILDLIAAVNLMTIFTNTMIAKSTPHLYLSALAAAPRNSDLMRAWHKRFPTIPTIVALRNAGSQLRLLKHDGCVNSVYFSHDGLRIISGSADQIVRIWDVLTGKQLHELGGHKYSVNSISFSPDGLCVISGSSDEMVRIWDVPTGEQLHTLEGHENWVRSVSFSPDGLRAISGSDDRTVRIWDVSTGEQLHTPEGHEKDVTSVSLSSDGLRAISGSDDKTVRIWHVLTGEQLHRLEGHERAVISVRFSPDGLCAISGSKDKTLRIWNVSTREQLHKLEGHKHWVNSVSFSPNGLRAISGSSDKTVRIWDVSTGKQLHKLEGHESRVVSVSFSPDGLRAISGSSDKMLRIWDVSTGEKLHQLEGHEGWLVSVSFSPDGLHTISDSKDNTVHIWDVLTGEHLHKLEGHEHSVSSVSSSPDGLRAISGSDDMTVRIWDVSTGEQLHKLEGHKAG